jgi:carbon-monoxide dehydrogenase medium subunit
MMPLGAIETSKEILKGWPAIAEAAGQIASAQVRSRATLGGNLCNAAPSADMAPMLIAYDASAVLSNGETARSIPLEDFFTGPGETALGLGELMKEVRLPSPPPRSCATYLKASRSGMDLAVAGVGIRVVFEPNGKTCRDLRLVLGAVAPTPMRAKESEHMAVGRRLDDELIERLGNRASEEARPISDVRSTASYRRRLIKVMTQRALRAARSWTEEGGSR